MCLGLVSTRVLRSSLYAEDRERRPDNVIGRYSEMFPTLAPTVPRQKGDHFGSYEYHFLFMVHTKAQTTTTAIKRPLERPITPAKSLVKYACLRDATFQSTTMSTTHSSEATREVEAMKISLQGWASNRWSAARRVFRMWIVLTRRVLTPC